jgi:uncharacterized protein YkwD
MSQNTSLRILWPIWPSRPTFRYVMAIVFIFMAMNPVMTNAQDAQNRSCPQRFFFVNVPPAFQSSGKTFEENQCSNRKGRMMVSAAALKMIALVNQERMEAGLAKLELDATLMKLAGEKSLDMVRFNYFGHYSKRFGTIYDQLDRAQFQYQVAAENLIGAPNLIRAAQTVFSSPAHRSNILNPHFRRIGIGIVRGGPYGEMMVQIFVD